MSDIQPPILTDLGHAPAAVCSRWMGDSPCGGAATHHVIWDYDMRNGAVCPEHVREARERWVYIGLHPYDAACAAAGVAEWLPDEDRCVLPDPPPLCPCAQSHQGVPHWEYEFLLEQAPVAPGVAEKT